MDTRLEQLWNSGETAVLGWLLLPDAIIAEITAKQGYDAVTIDVQHGLIEALLRHNGPVDVVVASKVV